MGSPYLLLKCAQASRLASPKKLLRFCYGCDTKVACIVATENDALRCTLQDHELAPSATLNVVDTCSAQSVLAFTSVLSLSFLFSKESELLSTLAVVRSPDYYAWEA